MTYKQRDEMVADLRAFADFIEENGVKLPGDLYLGSSYNSLWDDDNSTAKEKAKVVAKVLAKGGLVEKKHDNYSLDLIRKFGRIKLSYSINREKFCTKVVTGTKEVPAVTYEARTEEIYEWKCDDPVLAG